jgi:hypothetical protein
MLRLGFASRHGILGYGPPFSRTTSLTSLGPCSRAFPLAVFEVPKPLTVASLWLLGSMLEESRDDRSIELVACTRGAISIA